jgi:hypothetical protein
MTRDEILADPQAAQAALDLATKMSASDLPVPDLPPDDLVALPGGYVHKGTVIKHAVVRELNGEDEEALAKALKGGNLYHLLDTLISRGVVKLGDLSYDETQRAVPDLLTGDRDEIILGIRIATYGDTVEVFGWTCPECAGVVDKIEFSLKDDVERINLKNPLADIEFEIGLNRGAKAKVRLATGAVQMAVWDQDDLVGPQRDDIMLSKTIQTYTDRRGQEHIISLFPSMVRQMSAPDRRKIVRELSQRQPGPRYNDIRFTHDGCHKEVALALGITDLFRDLIAGLVWGGT